MAYWDTSCLLKLYALEADSADFEAFVLGGAMLVTSEIARLELYATLQRKEADHDINAGAARGTLAAYDADIARRWISIIAIGPAVVASFEAIVEQCYRQTPKIPLRTLDAIHIASATIAGESEIVATDKRLRDAAIRLGFSVYPP